MFDELSDNAERSMKAAETKVTEIASDCRVRDGELGRAIRRVKGVMEFKFLLEKKAENARQMVSHARRGPRGIGGARKRCRERPSTDGAGCAAGQRAIGGTCMPGGEERNKR
eukprot:7725614-Pyramimonas_sp.AAC.1